MGPHSRAVPRTVAALATDQMAGLGGRTCLSHTVGWGWRLSLDPRAILLVVKQGPLSWLVVHQTLGACEVSAWPSFEM